MAAPIARASRGSLDQVRGTPVSWRRAAARRASEGRGTRFLHFPHLVEVPPADVTAGERKAQLCILCHKTSDAVSGVPLLEGSPWRQGYPSELPAAPGLDEHRAEILRYADEGEPPLA